MPDEATGAPRTVRAPRGPERTCKGWGQEAALRMLMNNLDPEVAERPEDLVVYGGTGRAARSWAAFDAIVASLRDLEDDETLLVQSGKPVAVFRTHEWAPRVLIANANLVPDWANWDEFRRLEALGLTMYGQMTAGSWIYIGTQGILQGTYACFSAIAERHFGGSLAGTVTLTSGLGGMGGAQPLAVTMNGGVAIVVEVDPARIRRRLETRYLDAVADDLDDALARAEAARADRRALSIGVTGNAAEVLPRLVEMDAPVDIVTDQTPAHDPLSYVPADLTLAEAEELRSRDPAAYTDARPRLDGGPLRGHGRLRRPRRRGVRLRQQPAARGPARGVRAGLRLPRVPARLHPPTVLRGQGPVPVGGAVRGPGRHRRHRPGRPRRAARRRGSRPLDPPGRGPGAVPGPARPDLLARRRRAPPRRPAVQRAGCQRTGGGADRHRARPPRLRLRRVPHRETEAMRDGSDAIADWPLLNALLNTASGATWVSIHHGGGVGIGRSIHAGMVVVADGSDLAARKLERVLTNDPGSGVARHVDAGYPEALRVARATGLRVPMPP